MFGTIQGRPVLLMMGRLHYYEGYPMWKVITFILSLFILTIVVLYSVVLYLAEQIIFYRADNFDFWGGNKKRFIWMEVLIYEMPSYKFNNYENLHDMV